MAVVATAAGVGVSLALGPEKQQQLVKFYERARPPGFWGPVVAHLSAKAQDDGRERLKRGLLAVASAAASIYCVLTGVGTWLIGAPAPGWFPWRTVWIWLLLIVGCGLVPVWWRLGFGDRSKS